MILLSFIHVLVYFHIFINTLAYLVWVFLSNRFVRCFSDFDDEIPAFRWFSSILAIFCEFDHAPKLWPAFPHVIITCGTWPAGFSSWKEATSNNPRGPECHWVIHAGSSLSWKYSSDVSWDECIISTWCGNNYLLVRNILQLQYLEQPESIHLTWEVQLRSSIINHHLLTELSIHPGGKLIYSHSEKYSATQLFDSDVGWISPVDEMNIQFWLEIPENTQNSAQ